jgi:hypothetical protein
MRLMELINGSSLMEGGSEKSTWMNGAVADELLLLRENKL